MPPAITGDQTHVYYDVHCRKPYVNDDDNECADKECESIVTYLPRKEGLNVTHAIVTNLSPFVNYAFKIYAKNRVSEVAKRRHGVEGNYTAISLRTNGSSKFLIFTTCVYYIKYPIERIVLVPIVHYCNKVVLKRSYCVSLVLILSQVKLQNTTMYNILPH